MFWVCVDAHMYVQLCHFSSLWSHSISLLRLRTWQTSSYHDWLSHYHRFQTSQSPSTDQYRAHALVNQFSELLTLCVHFLFGLWFSAVFICYVGYVRDTTCLQRVPKYYFLTCLQTCQTCRHMSPRHIMKTFLFQGPQRHRKDMTSRHVFTTIILLVMTCMWYLHETIMT